MVVVYKLVEVLLIVEVELVVSREVVPPMTRAMVDNSVAVMPEDVWVTTLVAKLVEPPETWVRVTGQMVVLSSMTTVVMTSDSAEVTAASVTATPAAVAVLETLAADEADAIDDV